jgi:hypothetical protein
MMYWIQKVMHTIHQHKAMGSSSSKTWWIPIGNYWGFMNPFFVKYFLVWEKYTFYLYPKAQYNYLEVLITNYLPRVENRV